MLLRRADPRSWLLSMLLVVCVWCLFASSAHAAASWQTGTTQESTITDCITSSSSPGSAATAYVYEDYSNPPPAGQTYYLAVTVFGIGDACSGQAADIDLTLPQDTSLNISSATPVTCFPLVSSGNTVVDGPSDTSGACPQDPTSLGGGKYSFDMAANAGFDKTSFYPFWGIPRGAGVELHIPVVSSAAFTGTAAAQVTMLDGNSNPTLTPSVSVIVGAAGTSPTPGTAFAVNSPVASGITNTSATLAAQFVLDYSFTPGQATFAWGTSASSTPQSLGFTLDFVAVPYAIEYAAAVSGLQPGCTYHWNANLLSNSASSLATSGDQTFTTTGSGGNCSASGIGGSSGGSGSTEIYKRPPLTPTAPVPNGLTPPPPETTTTTTTTHTTRTTITVSCLLKICICHTCTTTTTTTSSPSSSSPTTTTTTTTTSTTAASNGSPGSGGSTGASGTTTTTTARTTSSGSSGVLGSSTVVGSAAAFSAFTCPTPQTGKSIACDVTVAKGGSKVSLVAWATQRQAAHASHTGKATRPPIKIGALTIASAPAGQQRLKLTLTKRGASLLSAEHTLRVTLDIAVNEPGATMFSTGAGSVTLRAPVAHRRRG